nr:MAG TPA: hypothetical protein [Caudoviricetes sp.]
MLNCCKILENRSPIWISENINIYDNFLKNNLICQQD